MRRVIALIVAALWFAVVSPVMAQEATPVAGAITAQPLATVALPAESWPRAGGLIDWVELTFAPGFTVELAAGQFPAEARLVYVVDGSYTTRVDGPLTVLRHGQEETIPAGTETALAAGEAAFYPDNSAAQAFGNPGAEPLVLWFIALGGDAPPPPEAGITKTQRGFVWAHEMDGPYAPPAGDLTLTLRRVTLAPGAALTAHETVGAELLYRGVPGGFP